MTESTGLGELAVVERCGFIESRHFGALAAVGADGTLAWALGPESLEILPRSSIKPWQALACRRGGLRLGDQATAISAGSHTGQAEHVALVRQILADAGLDESALQCPPDWPEDAPTRERMIARGERPEPVRMNCSGKHAAMLATCVHNGWDVSGYLAADHPLQLLIRETIEDASGEPVHTVAVDGCGAPLFGMTLLGLARAAHRLVTAPEGTKARAVADAMRAEPFFVGGTGHANTQVMRLVPGMLCKGGAEGVIVAAATTGEAVAAKVIDGSPRATTLLALAGLERLGVDTSGAASLTEVAVLGGGAPVGRIALGSAWNPSAP